MNKIFYFFFIIPLFSIFIIENETFNSYIVKKKINISKENNFSYCLGMIPYFNEKNFDFIQYYDMIDFINSNHKNESIYQRPKLSIKITHLSNNERDQWTIFKSIVDYAFHKNVFIWISTVRETELEYKFYLDSRKLNYSNVGITLSTYNKLVHNRVDEILNNSGNIRLVKGYYSGDIKDWDIITENYKINAKKLISSDNYQVLATHDFKILKELKVEKNFDKIELNFFYNSINYVLFHCSNFINKKSFYIPFGNTMKYLTNNLGILDLKNILSRKISYLKYYFKKF